jgi:hypothetical protein
MQGLCQCDEVENCAGCNGSQNNVNAGESTCFGPRNKSGGRRWHNRAMSRGAVARDRATERGS